MFLTMFARTVSLSAVRGPSSVSGVGFTVMFCSSISISAEVGVLFLFSSFMSSDSSILVVSNQSFLEAVISFVVFIFGWCFCTFWVTLDWAALVPRALISVLLSLIFVSGFVAFSSFLVISAPIAWISCCSIDPFPGLGVSYGL